MNAFTIERKRIVIRTVSLFILSIILFPCFLPGQTAKPDSAQAILTTALIEARSAQKNVFLVFHATWCSWCKRLEAAINDTVLKAIIDENYIVAKLDVKERGDKIQSYENPGGQEVMSDFGGKNAGLPFLVFLNRKGKMIANSNIMPHKQNIGYPGSQNEITAFLKLLKKTAPHVTSKQCDRIKSYFELHAPQND
jgi:thioredoxin-related protein